MAGYKFLKRKGLDHLTDDFSDFPLSSPATKIRRLDAELSPIAEVEAEQDEPLPMPTPPIAAEEAPNEERALVLFKPLVHSSSPFSITLNSDLLSEIKSTQAPWSKQRDSHCDRLLRSAAESEEEEKRNRGMALVPWAPSPSTSPSSQLGPILHQDSNNNDIAELMEEADQMGAEAEVEGEASMMMDIEQQQDATSNSSTDPVPPSTLSGIGGIAAAAAEATTAPEGFHQWQQQQQQQHCLLPQLPQNISNPITWTR